MNGYCAFRSLESSFYVVHMSPFKYLVDELQKFLNKVMETNATMKIHKRNDQFVKYRSSHSS